MRVNAVAVAMLGLSIVLAACRPIPAQEVSPAEPSKAAAAKSNDREGAISTSVSQLVEQLRRHPPQPSKAPDRIAGLYMIEIATGEVTLIADQPDPGNTFCGSPSWSNDGKRIVFDAMRSEQVQRAHMKLIELVAGELKATDLGVGNCPTFSPEGDRIAFLLNHGGIPGVQGGTWLMQADGSHRLRLGSFGRPRWSPDGRQFMLIDFSIPAHVRLMDVSGKTSVQLQLPNVQFYSPPYWVDDGTILSVVGANFGESIAVIDVTDPAGAKVKETLWKMDFKGAGPDIKPHDATYLASTGRCVFIGGTFDGMALYSFQRGKADAPKRLEPEGHDSLMGGVVLSPDGRFALFTGSRSGPRQGGSPPRPAGPINWPLKQSKNPNYFEDASGTPLVLCGSQTWNTLQDWGTNGTVRPVDFDAFVGFLKSHGHNFTLLWCTELPKFHGLPSTETSPPDFTVSPFPWTRTGPGMATDGGLKFDLTRFDQAYFDRFRARESRR